VEEGKDEEKEERKGVVEGADDEVGESDMVKIEGITPCLSMDCRS
jgi:hypothetical protein